MRVSYRSVADAAGGGGAVAAAGGAGGGEGGWGTSRWPEAR